jgi:hypothetical protein
MAAIDVVVSQISAVLVIVFFEDKPQARTR